MKTRLLPKVFHFTESDRDFLEFSDPDKINIDSVNHWVSLVKQDDGKYPLDTELYVVSRETTPGAWWRWELMLIGAYHQHDGPTTVTAHRVRLHDGTDHRYWDGGSWAVAGAGDWNTEDEVNQNIKTFDSKTIRVVVNLQTTDTSYTPFLKWINMAWSGRIYFLEDIIYRSLVPFLRGVEPIVDYPVALDAGTATIDLNDYPSDTPYDIVSIDSVFDHDSDPDHRTDLFSSYNPTTKIITLLGAIPGGHTAWIRFIYAPPVIVIQSMDYAELAKVPAIVVENIRTTNIRQYIEHDGVFNKSIGEAIQFRPPLAMSLGFDILAVSPGNVNDLRLEEELEILLSSNELLTSAGMDEQYRLRMLDTFADASSAEGNNLRSARATAELMDVLSFTKPARTGVTPASRIRLIGDIEADIDL